ncbi:MAG: hypothetical protein ABIH46_01610 [Chloroflexota bacterium]
MAELEGYVPGEDKPRTIQLVAGDESRLGTLVATIASVVLGAGSAVIGKLGANSGVDIGDVTVNNAAGVNDVPVEVQNEVEVTLNGEAGVLGAGAQSIGKVDVPSLPSAIQGPGNPSIDSFTHAALSLAAAANQQMIAAPGANKQIWVYGLFMMADTGAGTVALQDEDDTAITGSLAVSDEGGWVLPISGNFAMPWFKVATNKALEADMATCTIGGIVAYAVVSV